MLGCAEGEAVAQGHKQRSLFSFEDDAPQKGPRRWLPKPWPRTAHCERFEALCAIHKANVTITLLFQPTTLNELS